MLTDLQCRKAKATDSPIKLSDGGGLHLYVTPAGGKSWRYRYEFGGKEKLLTIGPYPAIGIVEARAARDEAKATKRAGRDPSVAKRLKLANVSTDDCATFEVLAREWHALNKSRWTPVHASDTINSLERDVFPDIGPLPVREITAPVVLSVLRKIEVRPAVETARRVRQRMSAVFVYGIASGRCDNDPAAIVKQAMAPLVKGRQPAITDLEEARAMLAKAEAEPAHAVTKLALRLLALTVVRPGVIAGTPWTELDAINDDIWCVPAARMKLKKDRKTDATYDHLVALPSQALDVIAVLKTITSDGPLAFPNTRHAHKPMSENAMGYLLNRAGYHHRHVPHGWRATFSTIMNERFKADHDVIELMLAHVPENKVAGAYNRAEHLQRRKDLAQIWADLILKGAKPAKALLSGPHR
ncbi:Phage integrase family protein [Bradyrhizobium brasilense]|uniref:Phage integrase family protein n=1 Tax=Bradyrhizobium brasilense TaxID=1419277 RepID=A0A1G7ADN1_9BRAD|nr:integrase arm-type DNA-binding domain-containing protein [Bradyrhizobium brasilense]SDE11976.1 Phage integrase family protein [Bradyrhizobium brasilense]